MVTSTRRTVLGALLITTLISPKYTGYQQPPAERLRANVQMAFEELK